MQKLTNINIHDFNKEKFSIVIFTASWCSACPSWKEYVEDTYSNEKNIDLYCFDIEGNHDVSSFWQVKSLPKTIIFKNGDVYNEINDVNATALKNILEQ